MASVFDQFKHIAELSPERTAACYCLDGKWHQISYGLLLQDSNRTAAALLNAGVQPGDAVIVPARRHKDLLAHMLAILATGAHYVVVDDKYPLQRQKFIQQATGARFGLRASDSPELNDLDVKWLKPNEAPTNIELPTLPAETAAYVMFTSGSTGTPKGVIVPHRAISRLVVQTDFIQFSKNNVFLLHSSLSFDASTLEIWGALLHGGCCVLFPDGQLVSARSLKKLMSEQPINNLWLTASLFNAVIDADASVLQGVKQLLTGGETISPAHVRQAYAELPQISIFNGYGPTENTTFTTVYPIPRDLPQTVTRVPIGFPINGTTCEIYDDQLKVVSGSSEGELVAFGHGLALGYVGNAQQTDERFAMLERASGKTERGYRTGDIVKRLDTGAYDYLGRADKQVKIDGLRIEMGEIEAALQALSDISQARVLLRIGPQNQKRLAAYVVIENGQELNETQCREALTQTLPSFSVPHFIVPMQALPINASGKLDEAQLPDPFEVKPKLRVANHANIVAQYWFDVLQRHVDVDTNFLDAGGTSLDAVKLAFVLSRASGIELADTFVFEHPTIRSQETYFNGLEQQLPAIASVADGQDDKGFAVIGMACRFPGANNVAEFWQNLLDAQESISFIEDAELRDAGISEDVLQSPLYVKAKGIVEQAEQFDAQFFDISPLEADVLDPQQRIMLQLAWHAFEDAGYAPGPEALKAGVFVGANWPRYYQQNILNNEDVLSRIGSFNAALANEADFLSTRISYKLNLSGPSVNVFTACSTGLVAIAQACSALERDECDLALAGGVSISLPIKSGYMYQEGSMLSRDGHCRTFDADANGTTFNDGAGLVVLKRLSAAKRDGDKIYAVVKGCAVNNDGAKKASYTAPSIGGQVSVYKEALATAAVDPARVGFIETHGTATPLGDPIEVAALAQCYSTEHQIDRQCALGSVKSNIGHTIHASGVAGFIKAVLAVQEGKIPATLHYNRPNPKLRLDSTRFYINAQTKNWEGEGARIAAVSSLGVGGTNAHVILQEYQPNESDKRKQNAATTAALPFLISAKSEAALQSSIKRHQSFFAELPQDTSIADHAFTAAICKRHFKFRTSVFGKDARELSEQLAAIAERPIKDSHPSPNIATVFMFSGQGAQRKNMGQQLLDIDSEFRKLWRDGCAQVQSDFGFNLNEITFGDSVETTFNALNINDTAAAQPALFMLEYGIGNWLIKHGCRPDYLIGHSIGEYAAAALAGVLSFSDALSIVAKRGQLMQELEPGDMLAVSGARSEIEPLLSFGIDLAASNTPKQHVVSGIPSEIDKAIDYLERHGKAYKRLKTSHAFHSRMMEPILEEFVSFLQRFQFGAASIPIYSTQSGKLLSDNEARSADYWASQIRRPVLFSATLNELVEQSEAQQFAFIEVGPGSTLKSLASLHPFESQATFWTSLRQADVTSGSRSELHKLLGSLWQLGAPLNWRALFDHQDPEKRYRKQSLPLYPFDTRRHWVAPPEQKSTPAVPQNNLTTQITDIEPQSMVMKTAANNNADREFLVTQKLKESFEDITGFDLQDVAPETHFSEVGLDSLLLTQVATSLQQKFGGDITFRNLMEDYSNFADLAEFYADIIPIDEEPAASQMDVGLVDPTAAQLSAPASTANLSTTSPGNKNLLELVQLQLQSVQLQLQALGLQNASPQAQAIPTVLPATQQSPQPASPRKATPKPDTKPKAKRGPGTRISKQSEGVELTSAQRTWIESTLAEYQRKFAGSKEYAQEHRRYFADPRSVSGFNPEWKEIVFQIVTRASKGSKLWDIDDNELIDITNGFGPIFFGHSPDFVSKAVKQQIDLGIETGPQSPLAGEVARLFCDLTGNERCTFASTGSEAVLGAIRLARTVTGRQTVVMFSGGYHGISDEVIARSGKNHQALPAAPGIMPEAVSNMKVLPWGEQESINFIRELGDQIAAVLVEPVQSRNPGFHDGDYIQQLRDVTKQAGSALILDEVVTGFRVAPGGIQQRFNVDADLAIYGKVAGGGYPIGIIGGKSKFMDALDGGYWQFGDKSIPEIGVTFFAGTFVRHPLALAATKAVLTKIQQDGSALYDDLEQKTTALANEAKQFIRKLECDIEFEEFSSLFYMSMPERSHWGHLLYVLMQLDGIFVQQYRPCFLTAAHSDEDIEKVLNTFKRSLARLVEQGLIDGDMLVAKNYLRPKPAVPKGAKLGRNEKGEPAFFVEDPDNKGQYLEVGQP